MVLGTAPLSGNSREPLGPRAELGIPVSLDRSGALALHAQLTGQLRAAILDGRLPPGQLLPSSRALARALGVARGVIVETYAELDAEGYLLTRQGAGTRVAPILPLPPRAAQPAGGRHHRWLRDEPSRPDVDDGAGLAGIDFRLGLPSVEPLDRAAWSRAWRAVALATPPDDYGDPAGEPDLREALAGFVTRSRGLPVTAADLVVTSGTLQALGLVARAVLRPGDTVAFEAPGYRLARQILTEHGARILPIGVDDDGLRVEDLPEGEGAPLMVYCTPSHQYPLGVRLSVTRRLALMEWARRNDALILEDDYDSEFRYGAPPLPTLASLDTDGRVVYLGTLSKVLTPAVRLGYVAAPPALRGRIVREKHLGDWHGPWPVQRALADFIAHGHLERHVRRMRRVYARKREVLAAALMPADGLARPRGIEAGLHVCLDLAPPLNAEAVAASLARRGVRVVTLRGYGHPDPEHQALLLGYGGLSHAEIERGARILVEVLRAEATPSSQPS